jgi:hypothetical protein
VYIKTHDGTDWMSTYDGHPLAVGGPGAVRRLIDHYKAQGIEVVAWFVPKGGDIEGQLRMAEEVLDSGVKALYADVEPFEHFCDLDCGYLAQAFWWQLRERNPDTNLGVIYDPRPWTFEGSATWAWLATANTALPMCYWDTFSDSGPPWNDPAGCVSQGRADLDALAPGRGLEYIPMLQGDSQPERFLSAMDAARAVGASKVSVWRRGVVSGEVWQAAWNIWEPSPAVASTWPSYWVWSPCPWDGCLLREESGDGLYVIYSGAKFPIPSAEALAAMGRFPEDHWIVGDGMMGMVADVPWDGTLLREAGSEGIYVVYGGARFPIASVEALYGLGLGAQAVHTVPPGGLNQIPLVPAEGTWLREMSSGAEWQVTAGAKFALPSGEVRDQLIGAGALSAQLYVVPDGATAQIPPAPRERSRVKELSSPIEWQVTGGARFALPDAVQRNKLVHLHHLDWRLNIVPDGALAGIPQVPPEGTRIRELSEEREWQITGGLKFALTDRARSDALQAGGHVAPELRVVPDGALAAVAEGPQEGSLLKEPGSDAVFVVRCGTLHGVSSQEQLDRLVAAGMARPPVLMVGIPLAGPPMAVPEGKSCEEIAADEARCARRGWGVPESFVPAGCEVHREATGGG